MACFVTKIRYGILFGCGCGLGVLQLGTGGYKCKAWEGITYEPEQPHDFRLDAMYTLLTIAALISVDGDLSRVT